MYRKLRKNLGNKNCEFSPEHIDEIVNTYTQMSVCEREGDEGISAQVFDNSDFGYYKVTIERPKRLKAQFTAERIEALRYDRVLQEPMQYAFETFGEHIYTNTEEHKEELLAWCEKNELNLSSANKTKLTKADTWAKHANLVAIGTLLLNAIGTEEYMDFNEFKKLVDAEIKSQKLKITASDKKAILNAVSWYDAEAEKVVKKVQKFSEDKLSALLEHLDCEEKDLADFGYYATDKKGAYTIYETESDLRDTENVPLKEEIHTYFLREVKPHVAEAWINLDATKIGYEISFNKYFYKHTPLRTIEEVAKDIIALEKQSEGLIADILNLV